MTPLPATDPRIAAIDIGTNSIRLLVARASGSDGGLTTLLDESETVRLGAGVERTGRLDPARIERAVAVVGRFHQLARDQRASPILLAATSAVRDASNGSAFQLRITTATGLALAIVEGKEEARLTFAGATLGLATGGSLLVADLGGGSLELIAARDGVVHHLESLQLGSGRFTERYVHADPPDFQALSAIKRDAAAALERLSGLRGAIDHCIIVGGTAQSLPVVTRQANAGVLTRRDLAKAVDVLRSSPASDIAAATGLEVSRVRTLAAGATIVDQLLETIDLGACTIRHGGLREGLILDYLQSAARGEQVSRETGRTSFGARSG